MSIVISSATKTGTKRANRPAAETREHLLDVAERLFYRDCIRATCVDKITHESGVAPTTRYRLLASKDDPAAAHVDRYAPGYRDWIDTITSALDAPARERIRAFFDSPGPTTSAAARS